MTDETVSMEGAILNPFSTSLSDGLENPPALGRGGETLVSKVHGKWFQAAARGSLFTFNVAAVTIPVVASGLVSVCSLYNPVGSGKLLELVDVDITQVPVSYTHLTLPTNREV